MSHAEKQFSAVVPRATKAGEVEPQGDSDGGNASKPDGNLAGQFQYPGVARPALAKIAAIMAEIDRVPKRGVNKFHGYRYASEQDIKELLHPLLAKHGLVFTMSVTDEPKVLEERVYNKKAEWTVESRMEPIGIFFPVRFAFIDPESGDSLTGEFWAEGSSNDDKGLWKGVTGALKYIATTTFFLPTGDDPEDDENARGDQPQAKIAGKIEPREPGQGGEVTCKSCGAVHDRSSIKPFPSKFDNRKYGYSVGDPCFRCPECNEYVPVTK